MASFCHNFEVNMDPRQHLNLTNSCQVSLEPTINLAMKNPIVSRGDDGSNLWTRSSSPGRNHSLHYNIVMWNRNLALNFFVLNKKKWKVYPQFQTLLNRIIDECIWGRGKRCTIMDKWMKGLLCISIRKFTPTN